MPRLRDRSKQGDVVRHAPLASLRSMPLQLASGDRCSIFQAASPILDQCETERRRGKGMCNGVALLTTASQARHAPRFHQTSLRKSRRSLCKSRPLSSGSPASSASSGLGRAPLFKKLPRLAHKGGGLFQTAGLLEEELLQLRRLGVIEGAEPQITGDRLLMLGDRRPNFR